MVKRDLHTHTVYSDGHNTPEEMIRAAIAAGFETIGISDHSYTFFDLSYCMKKENISAYKKELSDLKKKYAGQIEVRCGIEQDYYSDEPYGDFDYAIGSVHYLKLGDEYVPTDEGADILLDAAKKYFSGDIYALTEEYFKTAAGFAKRANIDVIGHFDIISKYNQKTPFFDETHPRYVAAWKAAADALLEMDVPFEINTGAVMRGYRNDAYPASPIRGYIAGRGGRFIYSSDSHSTEMLKMFAENV